MNSEYSSIRKPEFFMLGAPKCGTTALASYLAGHPAIQVSQPKEPHYFCKDLRSGGLPVNTDDEYLATFFPGFSESRARAALDASVWYLYSECAVDRILRYQPNARFLVMLRNPVDMAYSLHSMFHFQRQETVADIIEVWALEGEHHLRNCSSENRWIDPKCLQYEAVCSLGSQLKRLYSKVDPARVHVELQDDMHADSRAVYTRVLDFMGIADDGRIRFDATNAGRKLSSPTLVNALRSRAALYAVNMVKRMTGLKTLGFGRPDLPMRPEQRRFLSEVFSEEILLLEDLLSRKLAERWCPTALGKLSRNKMSTSKNHG